MTTDFMVLTFEPTGVVHAMYRDSFNLGFLGKQQIERASEIKFNSDTQQWDVYLPCPENIGEDWVTVTGATGFNEYNDARAFEVEWLEQCALAGTEPLSTYGVGVAVAIRADWNARRRIG